MASLHVEGMVVQHDMWAEKQTTASSALCLQPVGSAGAHLVPDLAVRLKVGPVG